jgi:uncharacterized phiE125 gp8 family phage protein
MIYTRTPIETELPVTLAEVKAQTRMDSAFEDSLLENFIRAVALEIEDMCGLALLPQTIVTTSDDCPGLALELPVGPVASDADVTVEALAEDGTTETVTAFWLEAGRYPVVHLTDTPDHRIRVTYDAALADDPANLPADLRHAIADQVCRFDWQRGGVDDRGPAQSAHTARVVARYRRARL